MSMHKPKPCKKLRLTSICLIKSWKSQDMGYGVLYFPSYIDMLYVYSNVGESYGVNVRKFPRKSLEISRNLLQFSPKFLPSTLRTPRSALWSVPFHLTMSSIQCKLYPLCLTREIRVSSSSVSTSEGFGWDMGQPRQPCPDTFTRTGSRSPPQFPRASSPCPRTPSNGLHNHPTPIRRHSTPCSPTLNQQLTSRHQSCDQSSSSRIACFS